MRFCAGPLPNSSSPWCVLLNLLNSLAAKSDAWNAHLSASLLRLQVPPPQPVVIVISGPSGVGKDTVRLCCSCSVSSCVPTLTLVVVASFGTYLPIHGLVALVVSASPFDLVAVSSC
jgi:hypothetical protein